MNCEQNMDKSKTGGKAVSVSASNASQHPRRVTSLELQKAKQSALESKKRMVFVKAKGQHLIVEIKSASAPTGTARMLTKHELDELRETKNMIAQHALNRMKLAAG